MGLELLRVVKVGVIGADVSKDKLTGEGSIKELPNNEKGFEELLKLVDASTTVALESTIV